MSLLKLKELKPTDTPSGIIDKINWNFDQILNAGGGPIGLTGAPGQQGSIGLPGLSGNTWHSTSSLTNAEIEGLELPNVNFSNVKLGDFLICYTSGDDLGKIYIAANVGNETAPVYKWKFIFQMKITNTTNNTIQPSPINGNVFIKENITQSDTFSFISNNIDNQNNSSIIFHQKPSWLKLSNQMYTGKSSTGSFNKLNLFYSSIVDTDDDLNSAGDFNRLFSSSSGADEDEESSSSVSGYILQKNIVAFSSNIWHDELISKSSISSHTDISYSDLIELNSGFEFYRSSIINNYEYFIDLRLVGAANNSNSTFNSQTPNTVFRIITDSLDSDTTPNSLKTIFEFNKNTLKIKPFNINSRAKIQLDQTFIQIDPAEPTNGQCPIKFGHIQHLNNQIENTYILTWNSVLNNTTFGRINYLPTDHITASFSRTTLLSSSERSIFNGLTATNAQRSNILLSDRSYNKLKNGLCYNSKAFITHTDQPYNTPNERKRRKFSQYGKFEIAAATSSGSSAASSTI
jgi:hypothetical protein